jgi:hypothetical protein
MKYLVSFILEPSSKNPGVWWDIPHKIIEVEKEKDLKKEIIEYLEEQGILNKKLKFEPIYYEDKICGVCTNVYTEMQDENYRWKKVYFSAWITIKKLCNSEEEIVKAFNFKG